MKKSKKSLDLFFAVMMILSIVTLTKLTVGAASTGDGCFKGIEYYSSGQYAVASGLCDGDHDGDGGLEHTPVSTVRIPIFVSLEESDGSYNSYEVKYIGDFRHTDISEVIVEGSLISISSSAFKYSSVKRVSIEGSVEKIGNEAFSCTPLERIGIAGDIKEIGKGAFSDTSLKGMALPNSLEIIGARAFSGSLIERITIPEKVDVIGESAFDGCDNLVTVAIKDRIDIGRAAFNSCHNLTTVDWEMIRNIGDFAFGYCDNLKDVNLKNVKNIGMNAFEFSTIKNMTIGEGGSVTLDGNSFHNCSIGKLTLSANANCYSGAFFWSTQIDELKISEDYSDDISELFPHTDFMPGSAIKSVSVDESSQYYSSVDGVLFNEDKTEIIYYPITKEDKEYSIPDSVKTVKEGAFAFCDNLEQINLPKKLECIESNAFHGCSNIKEMHIPNGVKEISVGAFYYNFSLTDVYFDGTENEWEKINFSNNKGYDTESVGVCYPTATIHFNEETIDPPVPEIPEDHTHSFTSGVVVDATCTEDGVLSVFCQCGYNYTDIIPAKGHKDENGDYKCDNEGCDYEYEKPNPDADCTCNCHKSGFMGFIWKILRIFYKLFKTNSVCACGAAHY